MYKRCTTEKGASQQQILEKTLLSMMKEVPYDDISVRSLCQAADVSRRTFYRLFASKEDVLFALIDNTCLNYVYYVPDQALLVPGTNRNLQAFFLYWKTQGELLDALKSCQRRSLLVERALEYVLHDDFDTLRLLGAPGNCYAREITLFFVSGIISLILDWHEGGYDRSVPEMAELMQFLLTTPPVRAPISPQQGRLAPSAAFSARG